MPECELCGKPVAEDDAVEVVIDGTRDEKGVFHTGCWNGYDAGFDEQPDGHASDEAPPDDVATSSREDSPSTPSDDSAPAPPGAAAPSWRRKGVLIALGLLVGAGVAAIIVTSSSDSGAPGSSSRDSIVLPSTAPSGSASNGLGAALGTAAPRLVGTSLDGSPLTISPGGGARYAVVFLAHWCSACQQEVRELVKLANSGELKGINVAAVATATSPLRANYPPSTWLERERWPFPAFADNSSLTAANAYGVTAIPTVVLVAEDARVVARLGSLQNDRALRTLRNFAAGR